MRPPVPLRRLTPVLSHFHSVKPIRNISHSRALFTMSAQALPSTMKALINKDKSGVIETRPVPSLRPTYLLVKVHSIALNPTDWKHISRGSAAESGSISGCDYSGTVIQVGDAVTKPFSPGDRVCGCAHGSNTSEPADGAFAEYAVVKGDVQMKIPDSVSFEQAATFPLGVATVGQGLFQQALKLELPYEGKSGDGEWVLIYGGSSATGSLGIQFVKAAGYKVVTTCSPRNFDFVKNIGADEVFDYNDADCGKKINEATGNKLRYVWDTISVESSAKIAAQAFSTDSSLGLRYGSILPIKLSPDDLDGKKVEQKLTMMYSIFGEAYIKGGRETPASEEDYAFGKKIMEITERLIKDGKLKTHPEKVGKGGLKGALEGMLDMKKDKVSGQKLVYNVADTDDGAVGASESFA